MAQGEDITGLLQDWQQGDRGALDQLTPLVYQQLRKIAQRYMFAESGNVTLQPTALVNEAFERIVKGNVDYQSRKHFYVIAARMMRRILVDHARSRAREKRGGGVANVTLDDSQVGGSDDQELMAILDFDTALTRLAGEDARMSDAVELVCFGGLSTEDAAETLGVSRTTMFEELRFARAWLRREMA